MKCAINLYGINLLELLIYYFIWISVIFVAFYEYLKAQHDIFENTPFLPALENLVPGWKFLDRAQDITDIEWNCWKYYIQNIWIYLLLNFFITEMLRKFNITILKCWYIISTLGYISLNMGAKQIILTLIQPIIFFSIIVCGGKVISVWITSFILLLTYNTIKYKTFIWVYFDEDSSQEEKLFILLIGMAWIKLRCISFCIDYLKNKEKMVSEDKCRDNESLLQSFIDLLSYVYYLPLLYVGPIVIYEDFEKSFQTKIDDLWPRLKKFLFNVTLFGIYAFLLDLALHYIYFCAMFGDMTLIRRLPSFALAGGGLWMGFQFHVKYVITYGVSGAFARLDNIEAPPTPRCIARIHVYSQMWRYFDVGLYKFLVKYIYKPSYSALGKHLSLPKTLNKLIASLCTFIFIFLWHGILLNILVWAILNYCGIILENVARVISTTDWYKKFRVNVLKTEAMECRFIACLCAPMLSISAVSNFYLFGGTEIGHMYVNMMNGAALHNVMIVLISTYCCSIVSMTLLDVGSRTDIKRPSVKTE